MIWKWNNQKNGKDFIAIKNTIARMKKKLLINGLNNELGNLKS